jgi:hypothetical protein
MQTSSIDFVDLVTRVGSLFVLIDTVALFPEAS